MIDLRQGDCLALLKDIPAGSVDMVLTDPPYGTTNAPWDIAVDYDALWPEINRVTKSNAAMLFFSQLPMSCDLINSNRKNFRYEWIWHKTIPVGFLNAHKMPMRAHENILVFYKKLPTYNPQKTQSWKKPGKYKKTNHRTELYGKIQQCTIYNDDGKRCPIDVIKFSNWTGLLFGKRTTDHRHSTQKPVALLEYLINTYTNPGETVLDCFMGSGSTGVACINTGRSFIGMELDEHYFDVAKERIEAANNQVKIIELKEEDT